LAAGLSGICLAITMLALWWPTRKESFLLTWSIGVLLLVAHVFAYWRYVKEPHPATGMLVIALLPLGFSFVFAAAHHFFSGEHPRRVAMIASTITLVLVVPPTLAGYDGIGLIAQNFLAATLLMLSAIVYGRNHRQIPTVLIGLSALYAICALSFFACGMVILWNGEWVIGHAPDNWAERLNIVVSICSLTVVGALSVALNQMRRTHQHRTESMTDMLTGLLNRRGLISLHGNTSFGPDMAVAMFDLDNFKPVNDVYGHSIGDEVIRHFAAAVTSHSRTRDDAARLGGEEFALVMQGVNIEQARELVERIASAFAADTVATPTGPLRCTVSGGIGFGEAGGLPLETVLERADRALYVAKRAGRNRIELDTIRLAG
jgi:diguanylate cyclase (GGDEF)-like protein